jgi:transposase
LIRRRRHDSADRLAGVAGLAPVPRDSGRITGNLHRPRRFNRRLIRASYLAAQLSVRYDPASKHYYDRKRAEGKRHAQAVLALARRRNNVLWAMLRDHTHDQQPITNHAAAA